MNLAPRDGVKKIFPDGIWYAFKGRVQAMTHLQKSRMRTLVRIMYIMLNHV